VYAGEGVERSESSAREADYPYNLIWIMPAEGDHSEEELNPTQGVGFFIKRIIMSLDPIIKDHSLYLVTSEEYSQGRTSLEVAASALEGGIDILQMREKTKSRDELIDLGRELSKLCKGKATIFIVNDDPFLAREVEADGVHLGQEDLEKYPLEVVRDIMGKERIIGVSTHSVEQFKGANSSDTDYIAFGPIFPTKTKEYHIGPEEISTVMDMALKPVVFIGGINLDNIDEVMRRGARNIALIRGITASEDIREKVMGFKRAINSYK
jgi:thiamine-phosphate pyrophosphorylase